MISFSLSDEEFRQMETIAQRKGSSISELIRGLVLERIEDEQDRIAYEEAQETYRRNPFSFSLDEVEQELDLGYHTEFYMLAIGQLKELDRQTAAIITAWVRKYIEGCEDPRLRGKAIAGDGCSRWSYKVGIYRLLAEIRDDRSMALLLWLEKSDRR